jgi:glycosyltransferase involved in cell wall biosynthesis
MSFSLVAFIPTLNSKRTIALTIESILSKSIACRVVVIDSGSTDNTCEIARNLGAEVYEPKYWGVEFLGLAKARNRILELVDSEYLLSVDSDAELNPNYVEQIMHEFEKYPDISGAGGKLIDLHRTRVGDAFRATIVMRDLITPLSSKKEKYVDWLSGSQNIYKVSSLKSVGELENDNPCRPFDENLNTNYEDIDIGNKLNRHGFGLHYNPQILAYHHQRDGVNSSIDRWYRYHIDRHLKDCSFDSLENYQKQRLPYLQNIFKEAQETILDKRRYGLIPLLQMSQGFFLKRDSEKLGQKISFELFKSFSDELVEFGEERFLYLENGSDSKVIIDFENSPESDKDFLTIKPVFELYNHDELRYELKGLRPKAWEIRGGIPSEFSSIVKILENGEL